MPINAKTATGGGEFVAQEAMDEGTYPCRVVQAIYFGMQEQRPYKGQTKEPKDEVGYTYEFLDEFCLNDEGEEDHDRPRWLSERFPAYNLKADKAISTKRYKVLDPDDNFDGDFLAVVGSPCMVTISKVKRDDGTYRNYVTNVSAMRDKDAKKAAPLKGEPTVFDVDQPDKEVFESFPEWIQEKLQSNLGYQGSALQAMIEGKADSNDEGEKPKKKKKKKQKVEKDEEEEW